MSLLQIEVDADDLLGRQFSRLERQNLPFAIVQASNKTAYQVRESWKRAAIRTFDRPTPRTQNAVLYRKASKQRPWAEIYIRDGSGAGTAPAQYLSTQVEGGQRRLKGMEVALQAAGLLPRGQIAVPGDGAPLNQYGNVSGALVRKILSQLRATREDGNASGEAADGRARRLKRQRRRGGGGSYFVVGEQRGRLRPGIYERIQFAQGSAVRSIFIFVRRGGYKRRYRIFDIAEKEWARLMPFYFERELANAVEDSIIRGRT